MNSTASTESSSQVVAPPAWVAKVPPAQRHDTDPFERIIRASMYDAEYFEKLKDRTLIIEDSELLTAENGPARYQPTSWTDDTIHLRLTSRMPCPIGWCSGHSSGDDDGAHDGVVETLQAGDSAVRLSLFIDDEGPRFYLDLGEWTIEVADIDAELADLKSIVESAAVRMRHMAANGFYLS